MKKTHFERAIFLSWYCSRGNCKFCYMSTQKNKIKNPKLAKRKTESILAEVVICKAAGWEIEFLSGGYESYDFKELLDLIKKIKQIYGKKLWLNLGVLKEEELIQAKPYIIGVTGAIECINQKLHDELCPSKPISEIKEMFSICDRLGLKKSITIVIGLGESLDDIPLLVDFIKKNKIDRITFYALNPHPGTPFKKGPETGYYVQWIKKIRETFPKLEIIAGSWVNRLQEVHELLNAGADYITKFPSIKLFGSKYARQIEDECALAGRKFEGTMTDKSKLNFDKYLSGIKERQLKSKIKSKIKEYIS